MVDTFQVHARALGKLHANNGYVVHEVHLVLRFDLVWQHNTYENGFALGTVDSWFAQDNSNKNSRVMKIWFKIHMIL